MTSSVSRYAVMGNPIGHSKSPLIHQAFAEQCQQSMTYHAMLVAEDGFPQAVANFCKSGGAGLNVTVPFKEQAWALAERRSARAEKAGAVNTLVCDGNHLVGDNTDGAGLVRDLTVNHQVPLAGKRILILGAGGAVRGVISPILAEEPSALVVANRTASKAEVLAELFSDEGKIEGVGLNDVLATDQFDVIINGTAASLSGELPPLPAEIVAGAVCYDMMYSTEPTTFLAWAEQHDAARCVDGLGMLVEQAAEAFFVWRGVRPETQAVLAMLRN